MDVIGASRLTWDLVGKAGVWRNPETILLCCPIDPRIEGEAVPMDILPNSGLVLDLDPHGGSLAKPDWVAQRISVICRRLDTVSGRDLNLATRDEQVDVRFQCRGLGASMVIKPG